MKSIDERFIESIAPNDNAVKNGKALASSGKFGNLSVTDDGTVIFGECAGSGKTPYSVHADLQDPDSPVFGCSCPSRQIPCKHSIGLLYSWAMKKKFTKQAIPEPILEKRNKRAQSQERKEKRAKAPAKPKQVNVKALEKKYLTQIEGLSFLKKTLSGLLLTGLSALTPKAIAGLRDFSRELGNYYLPGVQNTLKEMLPCFQMSDANEAQASLGLRKLTSMYMLAQKSAELLERRITEKDLPPKEPDVLDNFIGVPQKLEDLKTMGFVKENREILQLFFQSSEHYARGEYVDLGVWCDLSTGALVRTENFRPFRAAKYIKEEDSCDLVMQIPELVIYPGIAVPRVRWDKASSRPIKNTDFERIMQAAEDFEDTVKKAKNILKDPAADDYHYALIRFAALGIIQDERGSREYIARDSKGVNLSIANPLQEMRNSMTVLELIPEQYLKNNVLLVRFFARVKEDRLFAQPLALIHENGMFRIAGEE